MCYWAYMYVHLMAMNAVFVVVGGGVLLVIGFLMY